MQCNDFCNISRILGSFVYTGQHAYHTLQVFDGLQVALSGIFKGIKKTGVVLLSNFIAYWLISIPLGYTLAFKFNLGLRGFWFGLCSAAVILCTIMLSMLFKNIKSMEK